MELTKDAVIDGRYKLIGRLGAGGMAEVWSAEDLELGRTVALKLLHDRLAADPDFVERFRREASAAAGLQHPNVVQVYDRGEWGGTYYIAMEYLRGETLKDLVRRGPLAPARAAEIIVEVLKAAGFAHRRGLVHRDFKPHNVIFDEERRIKVTDFGIARAGASEMTETGSIMGTAQYLSPEQAQGQHVTPASDLYSIGVMLFELLTGRMPFDGESPVTIALKHVSEPAPVPSSLNPAVSPELDAVVLRALAKDPSQRFSDAEQFIAALQGGAVSEPPATDATVVLPAAAVTAATATTATRVAGPPTGVVRPATAYLLPEEPYEEQREASRSWVWWVASLLILAALAAAAYVLLKEDRAQVPSVVGRDAARAERLLERRGFEVTRQRVASDDVKRGLVIAQDPAGGTEEAVGGIVALTVSTGPGKVAVPDVSGLPREQARTALRQAGLDARERRKYSNTVAAGTVVDSSPSAGQQVRKGSAVTLIVSRGVRPVPVPDVTAMDRDSAVRALENAGLSAEVSERETEEEAAGQVLEQSPGAGSEAKQGDTVQVVVATAPPRVPVPALEGLREDDAMSQLRQAGLAVSPQEEAVETPDEDGVVLQQSPQAGQEVRRGSEVTLVIGRFDPALNPDPTADPPGAIPPLDDEATRGAGDEATRGAGDEGTGGAGGEGTGGAGAEGVVP